MRCPTGIVVLVVALSPLVLGGCFSVDLAELSKDPPIKTRYLFDVAAPASGATTQDQVLLIEPVHAASPYNGRPLVYRTGEHAHEIDYYNEFLIAPGEQLTQILRQYLRGSGVFKMVIDPDSQAIADSWLSVDLLDLRGDYRDPTKPAAVIGLRASLLVAAADGRSREVKFKKDYAVSVPLSATTAADLVAGFSKGLSILLTELVKDLRSP